MPHHQFIFDAIGTTWQIDITASTKTTIALLLEIKDRIEDFDISYSRFRNDSIITKISQKAGKYILPDDAKPLFSLYKTLYRLTNGNFTPLIGQLLSDAGYDAVYSLTPKTLRNIPQWEDVIEYEFPNLITQKPVLLDFGAAGKGYLIDLVGEILKKHHVHSFCINAGGDILYHNTKKSLRVGLEHPENPKQVIGVAEITNESICGSAGNRRKWGTFHHIMHPRTHLPVKNILATWVIAEKARIADGLATALFFSPAQTFFKDFIFSYAIVYNDYSLEKSSNFPAEFFFSEYNKGSL